MIAKLDDKLKRIEHQNDKLKRIEHLSPSTVSSLDNCVLAFNSHGK